MVRFIKSFIISIVFFISVQLIVCSAAEFGSIKSDKVNVRQGPGLLHQILWVFVSKNEPVEILERFEEWIKIRDIDGEIGWLHKRALSTKRHVIIKDDQTLLYPKIPSNRPIKPSNATAIIEKNVCCELSNIKEEWAKVRCKNTKGWVNINSLWGVK